MSLKVKLTSLITAFVLLASLLVVGVFAVKQTNFNVGGNIQFNVKGIEASIALTSNGLQGATLADSKVAGTDVLKPITLNNDMSKTQVAEAFSSWSGLNMAFGETGEATIQLQITNNAQSNNYIQVSLSADRGAAENASITAVNDAGGYVALIPATESATFTITLSVEDIGYKASMTNFVIDFDMKKMSLEEFPTSNDVLTFTCDEDAQTASVKATSFSAVPQLLEIPTYVKSANGTICKVTEIGDDAFGNMDMESATSMTSVVIPKSVKRIGANAFAWTGIVDIVLPDGLETIGDYAFIMASLKTINIPSTVTSIGSSAFMDCSSLEKVTIDSQTVASAFVYDGYWANGGIPNYSKIVYIKNGLTVPADSWFITEGYAEEESDLSGYVKYTKKHSW